MLQEYNKSTKWDDTKVTNLLTELDKNQKLWQHKYSFDDISISLWVIYRAELFETLLITLCNNKPLDTPTSTTLVKKFKYFINAYKNRIRSKSVDLLFISPVTQTVDSKNKNFNIYHEWLLQESLKKCTSLLIEEPKLYGDFHNERNMNKSSMAFEYIINLRYLYKAFKQNQKHQHSIDRFVTELVGSLQQYDINLDHKNLCKRISRKLIKIYLMGKTFLSIIKKTNPTIIVTQDLCYGGNKAIMVALAKKHKIKIIEDQHGMITKDYFGYNYGAVYDPIFIPDIIMLWGEYWSDKINLNCNKFILGNSRFDTSNITVKNYRNKQAPIYLIVPDSKDTTFTNEVVLKLIDLLSSSELLFRCHPRELNSVQIKYDKIIAAPNVKLDKKPILDTLAQVDVVIAMGSYVSTTVYEALSLGKPVVYIKSTDEVIGLETVKDYINLLRVNDLQTITEKPLKDVPNNLAEKFMSKNWQRNWLSFLDTHLEKSDAL